MIADEMRTIFLAAGIAAVLGVLDASTLPDVRTINLVDQRLKRQSNETTTTTPKPRKDRPANIFKLISVLISETKNDTGRAFNEIGNIFNSQFSSSTPKGEHHPHEVVSTTPAEETDEESEPYQITREEFFALLRSNLQGLRLLFRKELKTALKDSTKNAKEFGKEFRKAITPYIS